MTRKDCIQNKLTEALTPVFLDIIDDSPKHAGHSHGGQETHFKIIIESPKFKGLSRVQAHRLINDLLTQEFNEGLHALSIQIRVSE